MPGVLCISTDWASHSMSAWVSAKALPHHQQAQGTFLIMAPAKTKKRVSQVTTFVVPFTDYKKRPAGLAYNLDSALPLLYGFSTYFTHPGFDVSQADAVKLPEGPVQGSPLRQGYCPGCPIHLKLFFLPGAENEACITHYQKEKEACGDHRTQIEAVRSDAKDLAVTESSGSEQTGGEPSPPGFVGSYVSDKDTEFYHGLLFVQPGVDWNVNRVRRVQFDPVSQEE